jgi:hypothetical protein
MDAELYRGLLVEKLDRLEIETASIAEALYITVEEVEILRRQRKNSPTAIYSFRDQLSFSIGFALTRSRSLLRRLLTEHAPYDARQQLAQQVLEHLEASGFEIDEAGQVLRRKPPPPLHRTP